MKCQECRLPIVTRTAADGVCVSCTVLREARKGGKDLDTYARELAEIQESIDAGLALERDETAFWDRHRADLTVDEHTAIGILAMDVERCDYCGAKNIESDRIAEHGVTFCDNEDNFTPCRVKWEREREEAYALKEA